MITFTLSELLPATIVCVATLIVCKYPAAEKKKPKKKKNRKNLNNHCKCCDLTRLFFLHFIQKSKHYHWRTKIVFIHYIVRSLSLYNFNLEKNLNDIYVWACFHISHKNSSDALVYEWNQISYFSAACSATLSPWYYLLCLHSKLCCNAKQCYIKPLNLHLRTTERIWKQYGKCSKSNFSWWMLTLAYILAE